MTNNIINKQKEIFHKLQIDMPMTYRGELSFLVHFQNAHDTPVQRWFPYREGFSKDLVTTYLKELKVSNSVFDPFSGSGTTLLAARNNNIKSFGIDVNPISALVSQVENSFYNKSDLISLQKEVLNIKNLRNSNKTYATNFILANKIFNDEILQILLHLKAYISGISNKVVRDLIFVAWLSIIEKVSNIKKEGNGIKYKNRKRTSEGYINIPKEEWERQNLPDDKVNFVKNLLIEKLDLIVKDLKYSYGPFNKIPIVWQDNCLEFDRLISNEVEFTFFSPPYCNCFDYFEIHKVELWLGDFVSNKYDFKRLKESGFRSNTNSLNMKQIIYKNDYIENLIQLFDEKRLWSLKIPDVVRGYFDDFQQLLQKLYLFTMSGGHVGIVVGNSAYTGVVIPTDLVIADIARNVGFEVEQIVITRHLTTSSQQKIELAPLKENLRESIVLLKK